MGGKNLRGQVNCKRCYPDIVENDPEKDALDACRYTQDMHNYMEGRIDEVIFETGKNQDLMIADFDKIEEAFDTFKSQDLITRKDMDKYMKSNDVAMADIRKDQKEIIDEVSDLVNGAKKEMLKKANEKHEKTIDEVSDLIIEAQNEMLKKADEKDVHIIKELSGIVYEIKDDMIAAKNEMLTENQDSQDKIKFILNELEEIKTWKKQKEEEDTTA